MTSLGAATPPGIRLARAVLAYLALMIAVITLAPFRFSLTPVHGLSTILSVRDVVLNVVLFMPVGFVHRLGRARGAAHDAVLSRERGWVRGFLLGLALSALIEGVQFFTPGRYPSLSDLLANATGSALGALLCTRATRALPGAEAVRTLALDLPLVGLTILMIPVVWLAALAQQLPAEWLLLPVASAGWIFASIHASTAPPAHGSDEGPLIRMGLAALLWMGVALFPGALSAPWLFGTGVAVLVAMILLRFRAPGVVSVARAADGSASRRFEAPTLRVAILPFLAFAVAAAIWPPGAMRNDWQATWTLLSHWSLVSETSIFDALTHLAVFTVLGYALAEYRGRRFVRTREVLPRAAAGAGALALVLEVVRGFSDGRQASALLLVFAIAASGLGAYLYILQLRNIRALIGREGDEP